MNTNDNAVFNGTLIDGVARNAEHPAFEIPSDAEKATVGLGDLVKVGIELAVPDTKTKLGGERFWVSIVQVNGNGFIIGEFVDPLLVVDAEPGDAIPFRSEHILDIDQAVEVQA